ncbi:surface antigen [Lasius niger]|uniref:Surface antigen n=1 Tax=Lasius niger TaxID=67767 RepID=A0A0J7KEZ5_LASNI|nr:surface antigen [Lasius niger]
MVVRCVSMVRGGVWSGDMGVEGEEEDRKVAGEVLKMGDGSGMGDSGVYGEGGGTERENEKENGEKGVGNVGRKLKRGL